MGKRLDAEARSPVRRTGREAEAPQGHLQPVRGGSRDHEQEEPAEGFEVGSEAKSEEVSVVSEDGGLALRLRTQIEELEDNFDLRLPRSLTAGLSPTQLAAAVALARCALSGVGSDDLVMEFAERRLGVRLSPEDLDAVRSRKAWARFCMEITEHLSSQVAFMRLACQIRALKEIDQLMAKGELSEKLLLALLKEDKNTYRPRTEEQTVEMVRKTLRMD